MDAMGLTNPSVIGDIKLLRMRQLGGEGVVTDGAVRDIETLESYGIGVFASQETNMTPPSHMLPYDYQTAIQGGGVLVMPGDYLTADSGGVVVVPKNLVNEVISLGREIKALEALVKTQLEKEHVSPGKYYPFNDNTHAIVEKFKR